MIHLKKHLKQLKPGPCQHDRTIACNAKAVAMVVWRDGDELEYALRACEWHAYMAEHDTDELLKEMHRRGDPDRTVLLVISGVWDWNASTARIVR